jgi:hypothetical protein
MAALTLPQALTVIAALVENIQPPFLNTSSGMYIDSSNRIVIPDTAANESAGSGLSTNNDGTNNYIYLNAADAGAGS